MIFKFIPQKFKNQLFKIKLLIINSIYLVSIIVFSLIDYIPARVFNYQMPIGPDIFPNNILGPLFMGILFYLLYLLVFTIVTANFSKHKIKNILWKFLLFSFNVSIAFLIFAFWGLYYTIEIMRYDSL